MRRLRRYRRNPTYICKADNCDRATAFEKPYCREHIAQMPYAASLEEKVGDKLVFRGRWGNLKEEVYEVSRGGEITRESSVIKDIIRHLRELGGMRLVDLASSVGLPFTLAVLYFDKLEEWGMITRKEHPWLSEVGIEDYVSLKRPSGRVDRRNPDPFDIERQKLAQDYSGAIEGCRRYQHYADPLRSRQLADFARKHDLIIRPRLSGPMSGRMGLIAIPNEKAYDCMHHATRLIDSIYGVNLGNMLTRWTATYETSIKIEDSKLGDIVHYNPGFFSHFAVVIDPESKLVESCWGVGGNIFQHHIDKHPYTDNEYFIYPVTRLSDARSLRRRNPRRPKRDPFDPKPLEFTENIFEFAKRGARKIYNEWNRRSRASQDILVERVSAGQYGTKLIVLKAIRTPKNLADRAWLVEAGLRPQASGPTYLEKECGQRKLAYCWTLSKEDLLHYGDLEAVVIVICKSSWDAHYPFSNFLLGKLEETIIHELTHAFDPMIKRYKSEMFSEPVARATSEIVSSYLDILPSDMNAEELIRTVQQVRMELSDFDYVELEEHPELLAHKTPLKQVGELGDIDFDLYLTIPCEILAHTTAHLYRFKDYLDYYFKTEGEEGLEQARGRILHEVTTRPPRETLRIESADTEWASAHPDAYWEVSAPSYMAHFWKTNLPEIYKKHLRNIIDFVTNYIPSERRRRNPPLRVAWEYQRGNTCKVCGIKSGGDRPFRVKDMCAKCHERQQSYETGNTCKICGISSGGVRPFKHKDICNRCWTSQRSYAPGLTCDICGIASGTTPWHSKGIISDFSMCSKCARQEGLLGNYPQPSYGKHLPRLSLPRPRKYPLGYGVRPKKMRPKKICSSCGFSEDDYEKLGMTFGVYRFCSRCRGRKARHKLRGWQILCPSKLHIVPPPRSIFSSVRRRWVRRRWVRRRDEPLSTIGRQLRDFPACNCYVDEAGEVVPDPEPRIIPIKDEADPSRGYIPVEERLDRSESAPSPAVILATEQIVSSYLENFPGMDAEQLADLTSRIREELQWG